METFLCVKLGSTRNAADHCFYVRIKGGKITLIAFYNDNLLIALLQLVLNMTVMTCSEVISINVSGVQQISRVPDLNYWKVQSHLC
jgi:hypothetical protein